MITEVPVIEQAHRSSHLRSLDEWFTPLRFGVLFAALLLAIFPKVILGGETFYFGDFGNCWYPVASYFRQSVWHGEIPIWNPLNACGVPFLAQWNTQILYPLSLFYLLLPVSWALGVFCVFHLFLAGMGMYFLAYRNTGNYFAAAIAGVVFGFNGLSWCSTQWPHVISSLAWMPWVVLAVQSAWSGTFTRIIVAGCVAAVQMLSGTPEIIAMTWLLVGIFLFVAVVNGAPRPAVMLGKTLLIAALTAALSAAQLLPFIDLLTHSQRNADYGNSFWSMPTTGWINYLIPLFGESRSSLNDLFRQHGQEYFCSYYLGIGVILLAIVAVSRIRRIETFIWILVCILAVVLSMGDAAWVYSALKNLFPPIGYMRYPVKFVVIPTFLLPLLASRAICWLQEVPERMWKRERRIIIAIAGGMTALIAGLALPDRSHSDLVSFYSVTLRNAEFRVLFLWAIAGGIIALRASLDISTAKLLRACLIIVCWLDVSTHTPQAAPTVSSHAYESGIFQERSKWSKDLQIGQARVLNLKRYMPGERPRPPSDEVLLHRTTLLDNCNLLDQLPVLNGEFPLFPAEINRFSWELYPLGNVPAPIARFLGVAYSSSYGVEKDWENYDSWMPELTVGQGPAYADQQDTWHKITADDFEPERIVYLPPEAQSKVVAKYCSEAKILSSQFSAQRIVAEIETPNPTMAVIAQTYYHDWRAYLDGNPVPLWRANYAFQALQLPAGRHHVEVVYDDRMFRYGSIISILSLTGCIVALVRSRRRLPAA